MANILKRLRELASREATCMPPGWQDEYAIYADAADEIERLRAALEPFSTPHAMGDAYVRFHPNLIDAARAALKETDRG